MTGTEFLFNGTFWAENWRVGEVIGYLRRFSNFWIASQFFDVIKIVCLELFFRTPPPLHPPPRHHHRCSVYSGFSSLSWPFQPKDIRYQHFKGHLFHSCKLCLSTISLGFCAAYLAGCSKTTTLAKEVPSQPRGWTGNVQGFLCLVPTELQMLFLEL